MQILDYDDFIKYIKEGLISTHNYNKYSNSILSNLSGLGFNIKLNPLDGYKFELTVYHIPIDGCDILLSLVNNYGYYPSKYTIELNNNMTNSFKFKLNEFKYKLKKKNIKSIVITFESKYEDGLYKNTLEVPDVLYHVTKTKYLDKISKIGLVPKSKNRLSTHPDRIHFVYDIEEANKLINKFKLSDKLNNVNEEEYTILEITPDKNNIRLHTDPNMIVDGCFTYDNISKNNIKK